MFQRVCIHIIFRSSNFLDRYFTFIQVLIQSTLNEPATVHFRSTPASRLSRHSFRVVWTTVTHCCMGDQRRTTLLSPAGAERWRPPGYRRSSLWPHYTSVTAAALAAVTSTTSTSDVHIAGLVHQSVVGAAPAYLADDRRLLSDAGRRSLQSNSNDMWKLLVPRTHNQLGDMSFSAAGSRMWNDLPPADYMAPGTVLRLLQTISKILLIWQPKRLITLLSNL